LLAQDPGDAGTQGSRDDNGDRHSGESAVAPAPDRMMTAGDIAGDHLRCGVLGRAGQVPQDVQYVAHGQIPLRVE
jgi:hypothetical protein